MVEVLVELIVNRVVMVVVELVVIRVVELVIEPNINVVVIFVFCFVEKPVVILSELDGWVPYLF